MAKPSELREAPHAYGFLLLLILCSLAFQLAAPDQGWVRLVITAFQAGTLVVALWATRARRWELRVGIAVAVLAVVGSALALLGSGGLDKTIARATTLVMVALAPPIIALGVIRDLRVDREITLRTMFGVLCIYLLLGMFFSFMFGLVDDLSSQPFFAQTNHPRPSDFLYFSFTTITTTGYGDFTAHSDLGRSLAITEALVGQIYLVTVVALIIGNIGRRRPSGAARRRIRSGS